MIPYQPLFMRVITRSINRIIAQQEADVKHSFLAVGCQLSAVRKECLVYGHFIGSVAKCKQRQIVL